MSLEAALDDERKQIIEIMERQKRKSESQAKDMNSRGRSQSPGMSRTMSRGISGRSLSRSSAIDNKFSITQHDPSERLRSPSSTRLKKDVMSDDELAAMSSDEEQISDTDSEFGYDDGGAILPNFATYSPSLESTLTGKVPAKVEDGGKNTDAKLLADAKKAEELDQLSATERAIANARLVGQDVPRHMIDKIESETGKPASSPENEKFFQEVSERKEKLKEYAVYKKKLVSPTGNSGDNFLVPYTSDVEERKDSELARILNEKVEISPVESNNENARAIRTITRGNFFDIVKTQKKPKTFLLCTDFSDESKYALEWCVGTVLVDGSVLYIINVIEDDDYSSMNLNGIPSQTGNTLSPTVSAPAAPPSKSREKLRTDNVERMTTEALELLKLTKLQVHVVCESIHHPIPRHFIVEIIHHLSPTLVIVGSKGKSALKGVLLGSLSNYLARKSNVPVMVVKRKLKKLTRRKGNQFSNNIKPLHTLAEARID